TYKGFDGGLYGNGQNDPPPALRQAALAELARIQPLNRDGQPAPDGKIVLLSIGMSNTTQEFTVFKVLANEDAAKNPNLLIIDGAQGAADAHDWTIDDAG